MRAITLGLIAALAGACASGQHATKDECCHRGEGAPEADATTPAPGAITIKSSRLGGGPGALTPPEGDTRYLRIEFTAPAGTRQTRITLHAPDGALAHEWLQAATEAETQLAEVKLETAQGQALIAGTYRVYLEALDADGKPLGEKSGQLVTIH
jgi:hypothetical protein